MCVVYVLLYNFKVSVDTYDPSPGNEHACCGVESNTLGGGCTDNGFVRVNYNSPVVQ